MYFKAGVLVPFYLACSVSILFGIIVYNSDLPENTAIEVLYPFLKGTLTSGLIGLCSFTIFLNLRSDIAFHSFYRVLCWFLLPCCFMIYLLAFEINWKVISTESPNDDFLTIYYLCLIFFHSIGLLISFVDFRNSMILRKNELLRSQK